MGLGWEAHEKSVFSRRSKESELNYNTKRTPRYLHSVNNSPIAITSGWSLPLTCNTGTGTASTKHLQLHTSNQVVEELLSPKIVNTIINAYCQSIVDGRVYSELRAVANYLGHVGSGNRRFGTGSAIIADHGRKNIRGHPMPGVSELSTIWRTGAGLRKRLKGKRKRISRVRTRGKKRWGRRRARQLVSTSRARTRVDACLPCPRC